METTGGRREDVTERPPGCDDKYPGIETRGAPGLYHPSAPAGRTDKAALRTAQLLVINHTEYLYSSLVNGLGCLVGDGLVVSGRIRGE